MRAAVATFLLASCVLACGDNDDGKILVVAPIEWQPAIEELVARVGYGGLTVVPAGAVDGDAGHVIILADDATIPTEGYRLAEILGPDNDDDGDGVYVSAHDVLGAQYGVTAALEAYGFRFRHPYQTYTPHTPTLGPIDPIVQTPDVRVRGFQLHTLHPIEPYFAFWEPSPGNLDDAKRIIDWTIKNRGNYVQYTPVNSIIDNLDERTAWIAHNKELVEYAHARGVRMGVNIQLFGESNLQLAYDLVADRTGATPVADEIAARLPPIVNEGVRFDVYHLSFGEFFGANPQKFVDSVNEVERQLHAMAPEAEMHGFVHVGATQRLDYMGENLIYYFLVKFVAPNIVPDIHTVMFYNLFEDAGGAYHHERFDEHLAYLRELMCAGKPHSYVPESAYWIAFDVSVPQYLPLYVRSRWLDLDRLQAVPGNCGKLDQHILFTTGWEWGYWLHDVATLRASYNLTQTPDELVDEQYAPDLGPGVSALINRMMHTQREGLIQQRLAAYLAGRDSIIDLGDSTDILSQPDRTTFSDLARSDADVDGFEARVMGPLAAYADRMTELDTALGAFEMPESRWAREVRDGFRINKLRARFVIAAYRAAIASVRGDTTAANEHYDDAGRILAEARTVVASRHGDLHDTHGRRLLDDTPTKTSFQYGYLYYADSLCFWNRELVQVGMMLERTSEPLPACFDL